MNVAIILAGGVSNRFGSALPKQYHILDGKQVISYVIDAFKNSSLTDEIVVVASKEYKDIIEKEYNLICIEGGDERNITVWNALTYVRKTFPECKKILFADSARPMLTSKYVDYVFKMLDNYDAVITADKITDSLVNLKTGMVNRADYRLVQTPEAFKMSALRNFDKDSKATAIVEQCADDNILYCDNMLKNNFKITYPKDLIIASALLKEK